MSAMNETQARRDIVRYCHAMHAAGWVANHDGNISARVTPDRIVCSPTSFGKADVGLDDLVVLNGAGDKIGGRRSPFSEKVLHLAVFDARPGVQAVVHAHPPFATAFGVSGVAVPHPFLPEAVVSLGAEIPTVPLTAPGAPSAAALKPFISRCDAVLIAGNGVLTWGPTLELAYLRMELVEHLCRIAHAARALGGPKPLPAEMVAGLVAKRAKAGLAAPEEGGSRSAIAPSALAARAAEQARAALPGVDPALAAKLAAEIARQMGA